MLIGQNNDVKFKVNVMGTSADATARVILHTTPHLSFPATKVGEEWVAHANIPDSIKSGKYNMAIEVMVGNRHFTPLNREVELFGKDVLAAKPTEPDDGPAEDAAKHEPEAVAAEAVIAEPAAPAIEPVPLIKSFEPAAPEVPKKITLPKDFFKFEAKKVEPVVIKPVPMKSALDTPHVVSESMRKAISLVEINHGTPIRLTKGEIVYE